MNGNIRRIFANKNTQLLIRSSGRQGLQFNKSVNNERNYSVDLGSYSQAFFKLSHSIANSAVVESAKANLILFHEWSSIPWSIEIAIITIGIRSLITFPLSIHQHKILAKYESLKPEINLFARKLKKHVNSEAYILNYSPLKAKLRFTYQMKQEMRRLIIRDNCHPFKASLVIWFQIPIWIIVSHAVRNMSYMYPIANEKALAVYNQLSNEGILWFTNLTQADPYYILPVLTGLVNLTVVQLLSNERMKKMKTQSRIHKVITNSGRGLSLVLIPIGFYMPSSVCFYWFVSSTMGLIQNIILYNEKFKRLVGIDKGLKNDSTIN